MLATFYEILGESHDSGRYVATPDTAGPWATDQQHGGPPTALLVRLAERAAQHETHRDDLRAMRVSADFVGPVPVGEVQAHARVVRAARSAVLVEASLTARGRDCLLARVWLLAPADSPAWSSEQVPDRPAEDPSADAWTFPYARMLDWRYIRGRARGPGPAAAWVAARCPLVADEPAHGLQLAALIGDSASGVSAPLPWDEWTFLNVDLDVHLARPLIGDWVLLDAATVLGAAGSALARSSLSDAMGVVGSGLQTLVVRRLTVS